MPGVVVPFAPPLHATVTATVTKMRFVGSNSQLYYDDLHNRSRVSKLFLSDGHVSYYTTIRAFRGLDI